MAEAMSRNPREAVVVGALRTPIGQASPTKGVFRDLRSDDLMVMLLRELLRRHPVNPLEIEDVILGCANQTGEQSMNVARYVALMAGLPPSVAGQTINRQCASSLTAIQSAAAAIMTGQGDIYVAGGMESMTHLPEGMGADLNPRRLEMMHPTAASMGLTAENLARLYGVSRERQEEYALLSHRRAVAAQEARRFQAELFPIPVPDGAGGTSLIDRDQLPRPDTSLEVMAALPVISGAEDGTVTAATACRAADGAAALLLLSRAKAQELGLRPLARVVSLAVAGVDPRYMGLGPVPATHKALARAGLPIEAIDLAEINEAFAVVALVVAEQLGLDLERVNVNGGALALGHPMGATGARIATTLIHEMLRRRARFGLATLCVGMGQGVATIFELET